MFDPTPPKSLPLNVVSLAWELVAFARPHLSRVQSDRIYVAIGTGDTFAAFDAMISVIAGNRIAVETEVIAALVAWLECYRGQDTEPRLRQLLTVIDHWSSRPTSMFSEGLDRLPGGRRHGRVCQQDTD